MSHSMRQSAARGQKQIGRSVLSSIFFKKDPYPGYDIPNQIIIFPFDQLNVLKVISRDARSPIKGKKNKGKKTWVKTIRFKNTFLNYFFLGQILPGCRVLWMKKELSNRYKSPSSLEQAGLYTGIVYEISFPKNFQITRTDAVPFLEHF